MFSLSGRRARRAWRKLVAAADGGDQDAIEAVWREWLHQLDDVRWELLTRWRSPDDLARALLAAAVDPARTRGERKAIGQFCARHGFTPDDDVQQVLFHALTGQVAQRRAEDPDGQMLAGAYKAASEPTRSVLREALILDGGIELIGVPAAARGQPRAVIRRARANAKPVGGSGPDQQWRMVRELPLAEAVTAVRRLGKDWRLATEGERVLFDQLMRTDPERYASARDALAGPAVIRVTVQDPRWISGGAVSADGTRLALIRGTGPDGGTISLHELPGGTAADRVREGSVRIDAPVIRSLPGRIDLAFAGNALIAASSGHRADLSDALLLQYADGGQQTLADLRAALGSSSIRGLAPCSTPADGFVILSNHGLTFCDNGGGPVRVVQFSGWRVPWTRWSVLATEPGGRVAVAGHTGYRGRWVIYDPRTRRLRARDEFPGVPTGIRFHGPDRLIATSRLKSTDLVQVWRLNGARRQLLATAGMPGARDPVVIPGRGQISVLSATSRHPRVLDPATLQDAPSPAGPHRPVEYVWSQWNSAGNRICVLAGTGFADVFPARNTAAAVADRPPAEWTTADLATVTEALGNPAVSAEARPLLELLRASLDCRFRDEPVLPGGKPHPEHGC
jgi:hypothetical protein